MTKLILRLHGTFDARWSDLTPCRLNGPKQQALIALLATGTDYRRARSWVISMLWSDTSEAKGRRNLRQLLHGLRGILGQYAEGLLVSDGDHLRLDARRVTILSCPKDGKFLEGFDLTEEGFEDWLRDTRSEYGELPATAAGSTPTPAERDRTRLRKRIMVLPFEELTCASHFAGIGDTLAHQLTIAFARTGLMDAISHFSSREISAAGGQDHLSSPKDLDYRVTGRLQPGPSGTHVSVMLEDCANGSVLWGEQVKLSSPNDPTCQHEMVSEIAGQIVWMALAQSCRIAAQQPVPQTDAHVLMMGGIAHMHSFKHERFLDGGLMLQEVAARCPRAAMPWAWIGQWHLLSVHQGWVANIATARQLAGDAVDRALDADPYSELALTIDGNIRNVMDGDFDAAGQSFAEAQLVNSSSAMTCQLDALHRSFTGRGEEAVALTERAARLSPYDPRRPFFAGLAATAYLAARQFEDAIAQAEIALAHNPDHVSANRCKVIGLQSAGHDAKAHLAAARLRELCPELTVEKYLSSHAAARTSIGRDWANALKEAGIPAH